jgi:hypothetical protein
MLHVKTDEIYGKNDVVNSNDLRKHIVSIDSRFRKSSMEPPTDFSYTFAHPYKNVIKARVASVEIPNGFYHFSKVKKNTMFRLDATDYAGNRHFLQVTIPDGFTNLLEFTSEVAQRVVATTQQCLGDVLGIVGSFLVELLELLACQWSV